MKEKLISSALWFLVALMMFDWGYTKGNYDGAEEQASFTRFKMCSNLTITMQEDKKWEIKEDCPPNMPVALHQFTPFPFNLVYAIGTFHFEDL
jgi:hypothetical protein